MSFISEGWRNFNNVSKRLDPLEQAGAKVATSAIGMPELGRAYNAMPAWARTAGLVGSSLFTGGASSLLTPGAAAGALAFLGASHLGRAPRPGATTRTQDIPRSQESADLGYGGLWP